MRPAIEVWRSAFCAWMPPAGRRKANADAAAAVIEADRAEARAELVREIVAELRDQSFDKQDREWMGPLDVADYIETKFGAGEHRK